MGVSRASLFAHRAPALPLTPIIACGFRIVVGPGHFSPLFELTSEWIYFSVTALFHCSGNPFILAWYLHITHIIQEHLRYASKRMIN